jgi:hypothetical protein
VRKAVLLSLLVPALLIGVVSPAVADDPVQITAFTAPATVDLPTGVDGQVDLGVQTSGTDVVRDVNVTLVGVNVSLSSTDGISWSGQLTVPSTTKAGTHAAIATAVGGGGEQVQMTAPVGIHTEPVISLAITPGTPRAGGDYVVSGVIREPNGASAPVGIAATLTLTGPGYAKTFPVGASVSFHHAVIHALPATWTASFAGDATHLPTTASKSLTTTPNPTRIVSFDAGPEPAYFDGRIVVHGYLQRYSPTLQRWVGYGGQRIVISRSGYATARTTDSTGYFVGLMSGSPVETGVWHASFAGYAVGGVMVNAPTTGPGDAVATVFAPLRITRVYYDSPGSDLPVSNSKLNAEYIRITNTGSRTANLYRWVVRDAVGHYYEFSSLYLAAGHSVYLHTGKGTNGGAHYYWQQGYYIWNNTGDTAYLQRYWDNRVVDTCSWGDGIGYTNC